MIASFLFSNAFTNRNRSSITISVTASGNQDLTSDLVVCSASFSQKSIELRDAKARAQSIVENAGGSFNII